MDDIGFGLLEEEEEETENKEKQKEKEKTTLHIIVVCAGIGKIFLDVDPEETIDDMMRIIEEKGILLFTLFSKNLSFSRQFSKSLILELQFSNCFSVETETSQKVYKLGLYLYLFLPQVIPSELTVGELLEDQEEVTARYTLEERSPSNYMQSETSEGNPYVCPFTFSGPTAVQDLKLHLAKVKPKPHSKSFFYEEFLYFICSSQTWSWRRNSVSFAILQPRRCSPAYQRQLRGDDGHQ